MMKQVRFLTILLMAFQMAGAQSYHPMLKDGKRWQCYYTNGLYELNFNYYLDGDTVIDGEKGLFIAMPSKKSSDGEYRDIAHPINSEMRGVLQSAILEAYDKAAVEEEEAAPEA